MSTHLFRYFEINIYTKIMKNKYFITIAALVCMLYSYSQEKDSETILRVEPNGVVVHKPIDVEHTLGIKSAPAQKENPSRTIDDFSEEELETMLFYADLKIEKISDEGGSDDDVNYYKEQKQLIEEKLKSKQ